ncbi:MAG TPA: hypothetical protein VN947_19605 [Polyangia bacterium]|nr:hypothetical protein [Polyangia bacterium]
MNWHWLLCGALLAGCTVDNPDALLDQGVELDQSAALDDLAIDQSVDLGAPGQCVPDGGSAQFPGVCVAGGWCFELPLPQGYPLTAVWAGSPCDVWASGNSIMLHFDGAHWTAPTQPPGPVASLWGTSSEDLWAVGAEGVYHWDGSSWQTATTPTAPAVFVNGSSTNNVWVGTQNDLLHWDGATWQSIPHSFNGASLIWSFGAQDTWVTEGSMLHHWDGTSWQDTIVSSSAYQVSVTGLWGSASNDVWAADALLLIPCSEICDYQFELRHYDGSTWTILQSARRLGILWGTGSNDIWTGSGMHWNGMQLEQVSSDWRPNARALAGTSPMDIWAVNGTAAPLHWNGSASTPGSSPNVGSISGLWVGPTGDAWAITSQGGVLRRTSAGWVSVTAGGSGPIWGTSSKDLWWANGLNGMKHWDGATSSSFPIPMPEPVVITGIWGSGSAPSDGGVDAATDVWAVAAAESPSSSIYIFHWDGSSWTRSSTPDALTASGYLRCVHGSGPNDVWAGGDDSALLHWNGSSWTQVATPTSGARWHGIWVNGPSDAWAASDVGLFHWDGQAWSSTRPSNNYLAVWGRGANDMFAVIDVFANFTDTVMAEHYDGTTWTPVTVPPITRSNEFGIAGFGASEMWLWNDSVILHHP